MRFEFSFPKNYVSVPLALIDKKRRTSFPLMARVFLHVSPKFKKDTGLFFSHHIKEALYQTKFTCLQLLDCFHHGRCTSFLWVIITSRIIIIVTDGNVLDFTIIGVNGMTFATSNDTNRYRSRMVHYHTMSFGEGACGITKELNHGSFDTLIFGPSLHDCTIIDTVHNDFRDTQFLKRVLSFKVSRDLSCGSRGCESTGKTDNENFLALDVLANVHHLGWSKALMELNVCGDLISRLDVYHSYLFFISCSQLVSVTRE
mmetsp:Transcript_27143/g.38189  ORF Transcript_27143/g.38189 Transcript_27143/m.38189 type:complete len:258 (-) Transcript_27143:122-895(-)